MTILVFGSMIVMALLSAIRAKELRLWRSFWLTLIALVAFSLFLNRLFLFPVWSTVVAKAPKNDLFLAVALYIAMLMGMLCQYIYRRLEQPIHQRPSWDWGLFLAPVFASPIVFIPLLAAFEDAGLDLKAFTASRLMIFFVAFQNGFFWKDFFERKRQEKRKRP